jgi:hypothetical protein
MTTIEVGRDQWESFCERITSLHHGALINIQTEEADGRSNSIAQDQPLRLLRIDDETDRCNTLLVIETGLPGQKGIEHTIVEPIHLRLKNGRDDHYNRAFIMAENGTTILTMHPGLSSELAHEFDSVRTRPPALRPTS